MKTLKKVLSVALVLAMALSLMTIAGAAGKVAKYQDFTDADAIVNKEAVDTLAGLGVINGLEDGSYAPNGTFTRAQAAKIIAYLLLGENVAASLRASSAPFADVPAAHWAAPFVQFCVTRGILNGVGDNKYDPDGQVTAAQFAKMLLTAAGYGKKGEYVGADWAINVIVDAQNLGVLDTGVDYMAPATRDQVARYAFNFYKNVVFVSYSKDKEDYEQKVVNTVAQTLAVQQGVASAAAGYVNGVASHVWKKNGVELTKNVWANSDVKVIYSYADGTSLYSMTTLGHALYKASFDGTVGYFKNGVQQTGADETALKAALGLTAPYYLGTKGLVVSLVDTDSDNLIDTVLVIEKTVYTLTSDPFVSTTGTVTIAGISAVNGKVKDMVVGYEGLKKNDVVLYYTDALGVTYLEKAKTVSGQLTSGNANTLTFGGAVYTASGYATSGLFAGIVASSTNFNADAMIWLDNGNGIIKFALTTAAPTLPTGVLVGYRYDAFTGTATAKVAKEDGVVATYAVAPNIYGVAPDQTDVFASLVGGSAPHGIFVNYALDDQGRVTLTKITTANTLGAAYSAKTSVVNIGGSNYYITNSTKVFYFNTGAAYNAASNGVSVTTGYAATAAVESGTAVSYKVVPGTNVLSSVMFVKKADVSSSTDQYVFVTDYSTPSVTYDVYGAPTYHYNVYAGSEAVTLKSASGTLFTSGTSIVPGIYKITVNERGLVTGFTNTVSGRIEYVNGETVLVTEGYVATASTVVNTNASTKFFQYDASNFMAPVADGAVEASSTYVHYTLTYVLKDQYGVAQWVYYTYRLGA